MTQAGNEGRFLACGHRLVRHTRSGVLADLRPALLLTFAWRFSG